jgi:hypothetical protein
VVEPAVGALAHAVEALPFVRPELLVNLAAAGTVAVEGARAGPPEVLALLGEQLLAGGGTQEPDERERVPVVGRLADLDGDVAVDQPGHVAVDLDDRRAVAGRPHVQGADVRGRNGRLRGPDPDAVGAPGFDAQDLVLVADLEGVTVASEQVQSRLLT